MNFDQDRSGTVEPHELQQALVAFGYNLSPQAMGVLQRRYATGGKVAFDGFVALCVRLRSLTSELRGGEGGGGGRFVCASQVSY